MTDLNSEFERRMTALGPFETAPHIAVALSGGADSLALVFLADTWAKARQGRVLALHLDHGLRQDSESDRRWVETRMARANIACRSLTWSDDKPETGIQAAAREARYRLLSEACREAGILHLLVGHHKDDQAETVEMRRRRQSGPDGLAGMSAILETPDLRLLRPLLTIDHASLCAYLRQRGDDWLEDPSNRDMRFTRARLRRDLSSAQREALIGQAHSHGQERIRREAEDTAQMARSCRVRPEGYAILDWSAWRTLDRETRLRCLGRLLRLVSGSAFLPPSGPLARLEDRLQSQGIGRGATLNGCRILPDDGNLLVCREHRHPDRHRLKVGSGRRYWDNRFVIDLAGDGEAWLAPLGRQGWRTARSSKQGETGREDSHLPIPAPVRVTLPAIWDRLGLRQVPHLAYERAQCEGEHGLEGGVVGNGLRAVGVSFRPRYSLSGSGFSLA